MFCIEGINKKIFVCKEALDEDYEKSMIENIISTLSGKKRKAIPPPPGTYKKISILCQGNFIAFEEQETVLIVNKDRSIKNMSLEKTVEVMNFF